MRGIWKNSGWKGCLKISATDKSGEPEHSRAHDAGAERRDEKLAPTAD